ncbi:hypothetical protein [Pseudomonas tussilaginis]|uniref:hypothetical protein n=1 Tax=Pseudomonas sp. 5 TaxID=1619949 RepID=UPI0005EB72F6|nr:hypothetical protein [Pseudomonas sp. 5]KJK07848.1 hypothetical protein UB47_10510 [Pseudomonas sp. 5]
MTSSIILRQECDIEETKDGFHQLIFSCLQWKSSNLELMPQAARQRLAVMCSQPLDNSFLIETLERAHIQGAMSAVKLIAAHKDNLYIFLDRDVDSSSVTAIEDLWSVVISKDHNPRLSITFACESEVYSGRSDYAFWPVARDILESNVLGILQYDLSNIGACQYKVFDDDDVAFFEIIQ